MVLGGWKIPDKLRWRLRQEEVSIGAVAVLLLAVASAAAAYLSW